MRLGLSMGIGSGAATGGLASFFNAADDGYILSPNRSANMFQDDGLLTLAAYGDPTGGAVDTSGNGHAAVQSVNDIYRTLRGREPIGGVRQILDGVGFDDWSFVGTDTGACTYTPNDAVDPEGGMTAGRVTFTGPNQGFDVFPDNAADAQMTGSEWIKGTAGETIRLRLSAVTAFTHTFSGDWEQPEQTTASGTVVTISMNTYSGVTAREFLVWRYQLEFGTTATAYQERINANDVTEPGAATVHYIRPDGADDYLRAPTRFGTVGAPAMTCIMAIKPTAQAAIDYVWGLGSGAGSIAAAIGTDGVAYRYGDGVNIFPAIANDVTSILTFRRQPGDTYADGELRVNGVAQTSTFSSNPTFVPSSVAEFFTMFASTSGGDSVNGDAYSLMFINRAMTDSEIISAERIIAAEANVTL